MSRFLTEKVYENGIIGTNRETGGADWVLLSLIL